VEAPQGASVLFISRQWLSFASPDPACVQLRALQRVLRALVEQGGAAISALFDPDDWDAFAKGVDKRKVKSSHAQALTALQKQLTPEKFAAEIEGAFIWLDYVSIPQQRGGGF